MEIFSYSHDVIIVCTCAARFYSYYSRLLFFVLDNLIIRQFYRVTAVDVAS